MAGKGAPKGNQFARKGKIWTEAIERALNAVGTDKRKAIDAVAQSLVRKALDGDVSALKEIGDRLEGKPAQAITGPEGGDLVIQVVKFNEKED